MTTTASDGNLAVCTKPLPQWVAFVAGASAAGAGGLLGRHATKKHPVVGAIAGATASAALAAPFIARPPGSGMSAQEAQAAPQIGQDTELFGGKAVCVDALPGGEAAISVGAASAVSGVVGSLLGRVFDKPETGAVVASALTAGVAAAYASEPLFSATSASTAQHRADKGVFLSGAPVRGFP